MVIFGISFIVEVITLYLMLSNEKTDSQIAQNKMVNDFLLFKIGKEKIPQNRNISIFNYSIPLCITTIGINFINFFVFSYHLLFALVFYCFRCYIYDPGSHLFFHMEGIFPLTFYSFCILVNKIIQYIVFNNMSRFKGSVF